MENYLLHYRIYLDGINGNDSNDGSSSAPKKTLEACLLMYNTTLSDLRIYIVSPGTYSVVKNSVVGVSLHVTSLVSGVEIKFTNTDDFAWYCCHINLQGNSVDTMLSVTGSNFYLDAGNLYARYVNFYNKITSYGAEFNIAKCGITSIVSNSGFMYLNTLTVLNTSNNIKVFELIDSVVRMSGGLALTTLSSPGTTADSCLIKLLNCQFVSSNAPNTISSKYYYAIYAEYSVLILTQARMTAHGNVGVAGNYRSMTHLITGNIDN